MKSTTSIPPAPGFYWFRGRLGSRGDKSTGWEVVRVQASPVSEEIPATVYVTGRNSKYGLHSCKGKWAGRWSTRQIEGYSFICSTPQSLASLSGLRRATAAESAVR